MPSIRYRESALFFDCRGDSLLGVLATPAEPSRIGVVIVVGGPQYRVGSHRQFVILARALASAGVACLRFDYRGMGDSAGATRSFESIDDDIRSAIDALQRETEVAHVVLWGLCDGASAAMMYGAADPRVAGIVAVNPWVRTETTQASARLRHYYLQRVASVQFWSKLARRELDVLASLRDLLTDARRSASDAGMRAQPFLSRMHHGWMQFPGRMLVILSGNDLTAREFEAWVDADRNRRAAMRGAGCVVQRVDDADHTFSRRETMQRALSSTMEWLASF